MTTRTISPEELRLLRQELVLKGLTKINELLDQSRLRIVDAPAIGCMSIVQEHVFEVDSPPEQYEHLNGLSASDKNTLFEVLKRFFEAKTPELNLVDVDFFKQG